MDIVFKTITHILNIKGALIIFLTYIMLANHKLIKQQMHEINLQKMHIFIEIKVQFKIQSRPEQYYEFSQ